MYTHAMDSKLSRLVRNGMKNYAMVLVYRGPLYLIAYEKANIELGLDYSLIDYVLTDQLLWDDLQKRALIWVTYWL